jgi:hypothetical protein
MVVGDELIGKKFELPAMVAMTTHVPALVALNDVSVPSVAQPVAVPSVAL